MKKKPKASHHASVMRLKITLDEVDGLPIGEEFYSIDDMVKWIVQYLADGGGR